ncbi:NADPH:quinone reductase [Streptomyces aidingensis]|uniref:2-desacetyl-2-hydroxyethyl bacteriochlorophyllide A dehydrogenase n=1 Tax=Streptomyces aidingensis TaxID=910347 RepID=A0A1I1FEW0_9ACTN|nr:NADPH:quinone reductase [Streptomyces aidingensis]SFB97824.1 2-desacetyl-2-hydroxyethyl bacteriochlorophyllide A dehydrogenase [Streptomyces aidingensis]
MRAAYIEQLGPPDEIHYGELPDPRPGPTDVLVEVTATTVNPVDTFVRSGVFRTPLSFPQCVGRDMTGTVLRAGPGAAGFRPGDRVWCNSLGHGGRQGAAAEQVVVAADRLYRLPDGVDPETAVAVVHPGATAHLALHTAARVRPGETVYVAGAAGNVGSALTVMAVEAGARVVATCSARDTGYVRSLGAGEVHAYDDPDLTGLLRESCPDGIDVWIDSFGVNDLTTAVELLASRGRIVLLAGVAARPVLPVGPFYMKDASILGFVISHATVAELSEAAVTVNRLLAAGKLRPRTIERAPLSAAADAHRRMEKGELHGRRLILRPDLDR